MNLMTLTPASQLRGQGRPQSMENKLILTYIPRLYKEVKITGMILRPQTE